MFLVDYINGQIEEINHNLHDITNMGYTYFFLGVLIKIYQ